MNWSNPSTGSNGISLLPEAVSISSRVFKPGSVSVMVSTKVLWRRIDIGIGKSPWLMGRISIAKIPRGVFVLVSANVYRYDTTQRKQETRPLVPVLV